MPSIHGQATNWYYAVKGGDAQQMNGHNYPSRIVALVPLTDEQAVEELARCKLLEMGGQIVLSDEAVPNPNEKWAQKEPIVRNVISAGSLGPHVQTSGFMCQSTSNENAFSAQQGIVHLGKEAADIHGALETADNTADHFLSALLAHAAIPGAKFLVDGKEVPAKDLPELFGHKTWQALVDSHQNGWEELSDDVAALEFPQRIFFGIGGSTVGVDVKATAEKTANMPEAMDVETAQQFTLPQLRPGGGRRYGNNQQMKDFGARIDLQTPLRQMHIDTAVNFATAMAERFDFPADALQRVLDKAPKLPVSAAPTDSDDELATLEVQDLDKMDEVE